MAKAELELKESITIESYKRVHSINDLPPFIEGQLKSKSSLSPDLTTLETSAGFLVILPSTSVVLDPVRNSDFISVEAIEFKGSTWPWRLLRITREDIDRYARLILGETYIGEMQVIPTTRPDLVTAFLERLKSIKNKGS